MSQLNYYVTPQALVISLRHTIIPLMCMYGVMADAQNIHPFMILIGLVTNCSHVPIIINLMATTLLPFFSANGTQRHLVFNNKYTYYKWNLHIVMMFTMLMQSETPSDSTIYIYIYIHIYGGGGASSICYHPFVVTSVSWDHIEP